MSEAFTGAVATALAECGPTGPVCRAERGMA